MSIPEPSPVAKGHNVPEALIECINNSNLTDELAPYRESLVQLIRQRDEFGRQKYGQPLMSEDGRSGVEDAKQELGDLLQYAFKCKLNGSENTFELEMMILAAYVVFKEMFGDT